MAMSSLPALTPGQPTAAQGSKPAQDDQSAGGFARLFAQASQPGKAAGSAEGSSRAVANRSAETHPNEAVEHGDVDGAVTLINDQTLALLSLPPQGDAANALTGEVGSEESALPGSRGALAMLLASAAEGGKVDSNKDAGLAPSLASDELAGIKERLDTLARLRDNAPLNPLGQAIAQVQQGSLQGGFEPKGDALKSDAFKGVDLKLTQATLLGASETPTLAGDKGTSGAISGASGSANTNNGAAGLNWTQQLQAQATSPFAAAGGAQGQAEGGDWLSSVSEALSAARSGTAETSSAMPVHAGTALGVGQSAATASASVAQTPTLSAPLASAEWQQSLGQQLVNLQQRGDQRVQLHLHPAELGPLSIHLKVDDQLAQAQFMSANPQVRAAIEQAIPQLREALGEVGIQLGEAMVGDQQQGQEQGQDGTGDARRIAGAMGPEASNVAGDALDDESPANPGGIAINGVDLYA